MGNGWSEGRVRCVLGGLSLVLMVCGCGSDPLGAGSDEAAPGSGEQLRVHLYTSLQDLAADSSAVAVVTAERVHMVSATEGEGSGLTAFAADVSLEQLLAGDLPDSALLRLPEGDAVNLSNRHAPMESGHTYLVFADEFEWKRGQPIGEWVVPGGAGIYEVDGDRLVLVSDTGDELPPTTTIDEVTAAVG